MRSSPPRRRSGPRGEDRGAGPALGLLVGLGRGLLGVLGLRLAALGLLADDLLARAVGVGGRRVGDHVDVVEQRDVAALAAGHAVDLAVAGVEAVVAVAAVERVAGLVDLAGRRLHVAAGQRPQVVVAVVAVGGVDAEVGEDPVVAGAAVLGVVAGAAGHQVVAVPAVGGVVPAAAVDAVARVAAVERVVARAAEEAVERRAVARAVGIARDDVVAGAAV